MATRTMSITEVKAHLLALVTEVGATRDEIVITRRGAPVARLVAMPERRSLVGSLILPDDLSLLDSAFDDWDPEEGIQNDPVFGDAAMEERGGPLILGLPTPTDDE